MTHSRHPGTSLVAELKRRRVPRTLLVYCAGAFAVLQGADVLVPILRLPEWTLQLIAARGRAGGRTRAT